MADLKNITVNGVPLKAYVDAQVTTEVHRQLGAAIGELRREVRATIKGKYSGTGSGRTRGNPGVHRPKQWTPAEIEQENERRGLSRRRSDT